MGVAVGNGKGKAGGSVRRGVLAVELCVAVAVILVLLHLETVHVGHMTTSTGSGSADSARRPHVAPATCTTQTPSSCWGGANATLSECVSVVIATDAGAPHTHAVQAAVRHYRSCCRVARVHVVGAWAPADAAGTSRGAGADVVYGAADAHASRFAAAFTASSEGDGAVLAVDADVRVMCEDVDGARDVWRASPNRIIGFYPRRMDAAFRRLRGYMSRWMSGEDAVPLSRAAVVPKPVINRFITRSANNTDATERTRAIALRSRECEEAALEYTALALHVEAHAVYYTPRYEVVGSEAKLPQRAPRVHAHNTTRRACSEALAQVYGHALTENIAGKAAQSPGSPRALFVPLAGAGRNLGTWSWQQRVVLVVGAGVMVVLAVLYYKSLQMAGDVGPAEGGAAGMGGGTSAALCKADSWSAASSSSSSRSSSIGWYSGSSSGRRSVDGAAVERPLGRAPLEAALRHYLPQRRTRVLLIAVLTTVLLATTAVCADSQQPTRSTSLNGSVDPAVHGADAVKAQAALRTCANQSHSESAPRQYQDPLAGRRLKIAVFSGIYSGIVDGVALTMNRMVADLIGRGHDVRVFSPDTPTERGILNPPGTLVQTSGLPGWALGKPGYFYAHQLGSSALRELEAFDPDIMHSASPDGAAHDAQDWARAHNKPFICSYHTRFNTYFQYYGSFLGVLEKAYWWTQRGFYNKCDRILPPTRFIAEELEVNGVHTPTVMWPRGVEARKFHPSKRCGAWREAHGIADGLPVVLFASRLVLEKNLDVVISVIKMLEDWGIPHRSVVAGDGAARGYMEGALPNTIFLGRTDPDALSVIYASSDVFFFPSLSETFGNVVLEAMAAGIPVVGANASGTSELVVQNTTGIVVSPDQPDRGVRDFAKAIRMLVENPLVRAVMGSAARTHAATYTWDDAFHTLRGTYNMVLHEKRGKASSHHSA